MMTAGWFSGNRIFAGQGAQQQPGQQAPRRVPPDPGGDEFEDPSFRAVAAGLAAARANRPRTQLLDPSEAPRRSSASHPC